MTALDALKATGGPGSLAFLLLVAVAACIVMYVWPRFRALVGAGLLLMVACYLVLAMPSVAQTIAGGLPPMRIASDDPRPPVHTLIVLDGDNRWGRLSAALRSWRIVAPQRIVVSGEPWLTERLVERGVPLALLDQETTSKTTVEQMQYVEAVMRRVSPNRVAVIASRLQMPRVEALVHAAHIAPLLVSAPVDDEPPSEGVWRFVPSYVALCVSRDALYEHVALAYYARLGLIRRDAWPANDVLSSGEVH